MAMTIPATATLFNTGFLAVPSPQGKNIRASINWSASSATASNFCLIAAYGKLDNAAQTFQAWAYSYKNISTTSTTRNDTLDTSVPGDIPAGTYDAYVIICQNFNTSTGEITGMYDNEIFIDAIQTQTGSGTAGAQIESVQFSAV